MCVLNVLQEPFSQPSWSLGGGGDGGCSILGPVCSYEETPGPGLAELVFSMCLIVLAPPTHPHPRDSHMHQTYSISPAATWLYMGGGQ